MLYNQSAFKIPSSEKTDQELKSLRNVSDSFRKIIVVEDKIKPRRYEDGVELTVHIEGNQVTRYNEKERSAK